MAAEQAFPARTRRQRGDFRLQIGDWVCRVIGQPLEDRFGEVAAFGAPGRSGVHH
ncbi:hypothetical protein OG992_32785 [Micromonospora sp. NBC_00362]|uniref:hypothetical protein n=1 Tax=unclassified Micromonospora TaxID=2617518 RepID=UPI0022515379|nr:hypothetical protein [Micromonospora sp. NBC_00362]MCX5121942.1 hypothetical protein [Micromonospora sp. NBC_00362]WTI06258.1 hypothetical protein OHB44_22840 [Micromonospora sp. NBC_00821]